MSKPVVVERAPLRGLAWALVASALLHGAVLALPALRLQAAIRAPDNSVTLLNARLEPLPESVPPPEVLKNTITPAEPALPRAPPKPSQAAPKPKPKPKPERLAGTELEQTLGRLSQTLLYPPEAVRRGLEGEVVLMLELDGEGRIVAASVASGSGHPILDDAAVRAARQLGTLGPGAAGRAILLPVRFRLI